MAQFENGVSGNPGGRPRVESEVRELARVQTKDAIATLAEIMTDKKSAARARVLAANALLDRGWGKPRQEITGSDGAPLIPESQLTPDAIARRLLFLLEEGAHDAAQRALPTNSETKQ